MGRIIEGLWDCAYCGTKGIGGSKRTCTNCGTSRDENTTFYLSGQKWYVLKEEAKKVSRKPDWLCDYCGQLSPDNAKECISCGATRNSENLDYFQNKEQKAAEEVRKKAAAQTTTRINSCSIEEAIRNEYKNSTRKSTVKDPWEQKRKDEDSFMNERKTSDFWNSVKAFNWTPVLIFVLIAALIAGCVYLFLPKEHELIVTDVYWERNIDIQEYRTVEENDWQIPAGGRLLYTRSEIHHYNQVLDHYETRTRQVAKERYVGEEEVVVGYRDLGNGYFEEITSSRAIYETYYETETYEEPIYRSVPIYQNKYYYEIERWVYDRTATAKATDKYPKWPELNLAENERESTRKETYTVTGKDKKDEVYTFTLSYKEWQRVHLGQEIKVKLSFGHGEIISVDENFVIYEKD